MEERNLNSVALPAWIDMAEVRSLLTEVASTPEFSELERYFQAADTTADVSAELTAVKLFEDTLGLLIQRLKKPVTEPLNTLTAKVREYVVRCENTVNMLVGVQPEVPKVMHFVWVGGSEFGAIQRDYMNIWRQVMVPEGHRFNLWYDSDALLAFEMNRVIHESARVHAMEAGGATVAKPLELARMIEDRARVLKWQMAEHLAQPQWAGKADEARIDLMVRAYGKDKDVLTAFRQKCLDSHLAMVDDNTRLRDVSDTFQSHFLWDVYQREVAMRGNFAAASDVVRLLALDLEAGRYSDLDYLPRLTDSLGVDISKFLPTTKVGVLQLLFKHNPEWMPGRDAKRYPDRIDLIPKEHQEVLRKFAESKPSVRDVFVAPQDNQAALNGMRLASVNGSPMNSHIVVNPQSGALQNTLQLIRSNYDSLLEIERRLMSQGSDFGDAEAVQRVTIEVLQERYVPSSFQTEHGVRYADSLRNAVIGYYSDGIRPQALGTIALTGPGATVLGVERYNQMHLSPTGQTTALRATMLHESFNNATEEEFISGWAVKGADENWLTQEQEKWTAGRYKTRYIGDLGELLKGQTLTFEKGWPVIEGRPVLDTPLLQRWVDESGDSFIRAMSDKLSGEVSLDGRLRISFEERQQLRAQAPVELPSSIGAQPLGNFNELLTRIAHGSLLLNQLSPVHRVYLGGLFGAQTLDDAGFAGAWERSRELAQNTAERGLAQRYLAIEQALLSQNSPAFAAGFAEGHARFDVSAQNAKTLKAVAFAQPLSVRAWGEHIGRIRLQTEHELRIQVLGRSASVLEGFVASGATSAKMMPQGLLIRGEGDPGRHCYPLVLALAAALSKGASAVDAMSARVANANLEPNANDSHVLLRTLDELRTVVMAETGTPAGQLRLDQLLRTLEDSAGTRTLMINTDNHSMLLAKVVDGASSSYRFYDPNFGVFGFAEVQDLRRGLQQFLGDPGISGLYGISPSVDATYQVLDLNGARIADRSLPSRIAVSALLEHAPLSSDTAVTPWAHHAALRARSLSENARLGQGLAELEGRNWARQLDEVTTRLRQENSLGREFIPMIETAQTNADGHVTVSMVNVKDPQTVRSITTADTRLIRIKSYLRERFLALGQPVEASPVNTLNAGFAIQSLLLALHQREDASSAEGAPLALSVRLHSYVVYSQMIHGVVSDVVGVIRLVREALRNERVIAATTSSVVGRALGRVVGEGAGHLLAIASVGFDIYELANADDPAQIARIGTQLFFDSVGLVLGVGGLFVGGTAGAFAGAISVPLAGIGFGVAALVNNYSAILQKAQDVGQYFYRLKTAYEDGGHLVINGTLWPMSEVVITTLDLHRRFVDFGTQALFPSRRNGPGLPDYVVDRSRGIAIRDNWGLLDFALIDDGVDPDTGKPAGDEVITAAVLPCTPQRHYGFEYQLLPGAVNRHDKGFDEARMLEFDYKGDRQFYFTPWTPFEHIVYKLSPVYEPTQIRVLLDKAVTSLYVRQIPVEWHGLITYDIEGVGGQCLLSLNPGIAGVRLAKAQASGAMRWVIGAAWAKESTVVMGASKVTVGGIDVTVDAGSEVYLRLEDGQLFRIDQAKRQLVLTQLDIGDKADFAALRDRLAKLHDEHRLASPYLPVQHFTVPFSDPAAPVRTRGFYDAAKERVLYARNVPAAVREELQLGTVVGDQVYFYHREHPSIWRVDASTGLVNRRYRLLNPESGSTLIACQSAGTTVRVVQQVKGQDGESYRLDYLVQGDQIHLSAMAMTVTDAQEATLDEMPVWQGWQGFLGQFSLSDAYADATPNMASDIKQWQPPLYLSMQVHSKTRTYTAWLRLRDNWLIHSTDTVADRVVLLMPETDEHDRFLVYTTADRRLLRGTRAEGDDITAETVLEGIKSLTSLGRSYLAVTDTGLMFDVRGVGTVQLCGVNLTWLEQQGHWLSALALLAEQYSVTGFEVTGLTTTWGGALVGWYQNKRLLLVDAERTQGLRFLAATADQRYAWLFAPTTGQLYRQAYLDDPQLSAAFAQGTRLLPGHPLAAAQREWPEWTFAEVELHGSGLRGLTREGIQLDLQYARPARIVGVTGQWLLANAATVYPRDVRVKAALKKLVSQHPHHPQLSVIGYPGYHWYVSDNDLVLGETNTSLETRMLGGRNKTTALLHQVPSELTYSSSRDVWVPQSFARREADVLTLQLQGNFTDLGPMLPDGVTQLVLGTGSDALSCRVSLAVWRRLECLVLDSSWRSGDRAAALSTTVIMDVGPQDLWRVDQVDEQLLLTEPDSGHSLVLSDVRSADPASRNQVSLGLHVLGETQTVTLEQLIGALRSGQVDSLAALVRRMNAM